MYESMSKNNELENEMTLDMSYFWYLDVSLIFPLRNSLQPTHWLIPYCHIPQAYLEDQVLRVVKSSWCSNSWQYSVLAFPQMQTKLISDCLVPSYILLFLECGKHYQTNDIR